MKGVPGGGRRGDRGGVVDGGPGEETEAFVAHAHGAAQRGEQQGRQNVEEEDHGDGLGDLLVIRADDGGGGGNGAAAADGGAHTNQHRDVAGHGQQLAQEKGDQQRDRDGGADDGQGLGAHLGDFREVQAEAQQDHRVLQDLLGGKCDTRLITCPVPQDQGKDHTHQNGENRSADHRERAAQQPAGDGQDQAQQQAGAGFFHKFHRKILPFQTIFCLDDLIIDQRNDKIK